MLHGQTGKHKRSKNKSHELTERLSTVCFQNSPAESSDASPPSQSLPRSSFALSITPSLLSPSLTISLLSLSPLHYLILSLPPPETKCLKRKERTPFLLISWGFNRRRICCLSFSSAVHGLSTVQWSWSCVAKSRRKERGRHTQNASVEILNRPPVGVELKMGTNH